MATAARSVGEPEGNSDEAEAMLKSPGKRAHASQPAGANNDFRKIFMRKSDRSIRCDELDTRSHQMELSPDPGPDLAPLRITFQYS
jgi:hypothetical protein